MFKTYITSIVGLYFFISSYALSVASELDENSLAWMRWRELPILELGFVACVSSVLLYLTFTAHSSKPTKINQEDEKKKKRDAQKEKVLKYFHKLLDDSDTLSNRDFFKRYNSWLRWLFLEQWVLNAHRITLGELVLIKNIEKSSVLKIFKKSYKYEYSDKSVSSETRKKYISDILWEINK